MCFHEQQRPFQGNFDGIDERMGEQSKTDRQEPLRRLCQTSLELLYALDSEMNLLAHQLPSQLLQLCKSGSFLNVKPKSMAKLLVITGAGADDHLELAPFPSADVALVRVVLHLANTPVHGMRSLVGVVVHCLRAGRRRCFWVLHAWLLPRLGLGSLLLGRGFLDLARSSRTLQKTWAQAAGLAFSPSFVDFLVVSSENTCSLSWAAWAFWSFSRSRLSCSKEARPAADGTEATCKAAAAGSALS